MKVQESKSIQWILSIVGFWLLTLSGLLAMTEVIFSDSIGPKDWLRPLGPWSIAFLVYANLLKLEKTTILPDHVMRNEKKSAEQAASSNR